VSLISVNGARPEYELILGLKSGVATGGNTQHADPSATVTPSKISQRVSFPPRLHTSNSPPANKTAAKIGAEQ
jgi:hypothetical protein